MNKPVPNAYPELPVVPYKKTTTRMADVVTELQSMQSVMREVKRFAYILFRIESQNGQHGFNNNYGGVQADGHRWGSQYDTLFNGTLVLQENGTHFPRRFLSFPSMRAFLLFLTDRLTGRGLYVGGHTHLITQMRILTPADLCKAYYIEWVTGDPLATVTHTQLKDFLSMYKQSEMYFPG